MLTMHFSDTRPDCFFRLALSPRPWAQLATLAFNPVVVMATNCILSAIFSHTLINKQNQLQCYCFWLDKFARFCRAN